MILYWKKQFEFIQQLRDNYDEMKLLHLIQNQKIKNKRYYYAYYALIDLGNKQIKEIVIDKILAIDDKPFSGDSTAYKTMEYGRILAYIERYQ